MAINWDAFSSIALVVIAVAMATVFFTDRLRLPPPPEPVLIEDWAEHNQAGIPLGGAETAPLIITEFMDFTCPYCGSLAETTDSLVERFPSQFAVIFQHFPLLPGANSNSMAAAMAAECAAEQDMFKEMYQSLFAHRTRIGRWDWIDFASEAGLPDQTAFNACMERPAETFPRIAKGREIGQETGVRGTPTVWVNGEVVIARTIDEFLQIAEERGIQLDPSQ